MRSLDSEDPRIWRPSRRLGEAQAIGRRDTRKHVDAGEWRLGHFLEYQRDATDQRAGRKGCPNIDTGGPFAGFGEKGDVRISRVEGIFRKFPEAFAIERQDRNKPFSLGFAGNVFAAAGDCPYRVRVMCHDPLHDAGMADALYLVACRLDEFVQSGRSRA